MGEKLKMMEKQKTKMKKRGKIVKNRPKNGGK